MSITSLFPNRKYQTTTMLQTGMTYDVNGTVFPLQQGVPQRSIYVYEVVPAPLASNCLSDSNDTTGEAVTGFQPLNTFASIVGDPISNVSSTYVQSYNGTPTVFFDVERCPTITFEAGGGGASEECTVYFTGIDYRGVPITSTITVPSTQEAGTTITANSPMLGIQYIYIDGTIGTVGNPQIVTFGNSNCIGLPYYLSSIGNILAYGYRNVKNNTSTNIDPSSFDNFFEPGNNWRNTAPSAETCARGFFITDDNLSQDEGDIAYMVSYYVNGGDSELNNLLQNAVFSSSNENDCYGLNAFATIGCQLTDSGTQYAYPILTSADLVGLQYASNSTTNIGSVSTTSSDSIFYKAYTDFIANN